jgi:hypothetical protein
MRRAPGERAAGENITRRRTLGYNLTNFCLVAVLAWDPAEKQKPGKQ